jgi:hypothetical protein
VLDADDRLRLDYDQTNQLLRALMDVRFKLLAFVPTVSGAAVALLGRPRPAAELVGVGLLGLVATFGVFVYELRNSQLLDGLVHRAGELERLLGLRSVLGSQGAGGLFTERPPHSLRLTPFLPPVGHDRGLSLVYAAALAGWTYLVAWGTLAALEVPEPRGTGGVIGAAAGLLVLFGVGRIGRRSDRAGASAATERRPD